MTKNDANARSAFAADREDQEKLVRTHPDDARALCVLGLIDAALGRKDEAIRESRRAVELLPVERDPLGGARMIACLAMLLHGSATKISPANSLQMPFDTRPLPAMDI